MQSDYVSSGKATGPSNRDLSAFDAGVTVRSYIPPLSHNSSLRDA
jgi:hypothetical protein